MRMYRLLLTRQPVRLRRPKFWPRVIAALPVVVLAAFGVAKLYSVWRLLSRQVNLIVAEQLDQTLKGHQFWLGPVDVSVPGLVVIHGLRISSHPTFAEDNGRYALDARSVIVQYDTDGLFRDATNAQHYVRTIVLDRPVAQAERLPSRMFNFTDLFRKPRKNAKPFAAIVEVRDATLSYRDDLLPPDPGIAYTLNTAYHVYGSVDCRSSRIIEFYATGRGGRDRRFKSIVVNGDASRIPFTTDMSARTDGVDPEPYRISGRAVGADIAYWKRFISLIPKARVMSGTADVRLTFLVSRIPRSPQAAGSAVPPDIYGSSAPTMHSVLRPIPFDVVGTATVHHATAMWLDSSYLVAPLVDLNGRVSFTKTAARCDGDFMLNGQQLHVAGAIFGFTPQTPVPRVEMTVTGAGFKARPLAEAFRNVVIPPGFVVGPSTANITLAGLGTDLTAQGAVAVSSIGYGNNAATGISADILYAHKRLGIFGATFQIDHSGAGSLDASVDLTGPHVKYVASGKLDRLDISRLNISAADLRGGPVASTDCAVRLQRAAKVERPTIMIRRDCGRQVYVPPAPALPSGSAAPPLQSPNGAAPLAVGPLPSAVPGVGPVRATGQMLPPPPGWVGNGPIAGTLDADFVAVDTGAQPRIISNVLVTEARAFRTPLLTTQGRVILNVGQTVHLDRVAVDDPNGRAVISGDIGLTDQSPRLSLHVDAAGLALGPLLQPYVNADIGGIGYFEGTVDGTFGDPIASGDVHVFRSHYGRFDTDIIHGQLVASRESVALSSFEIRRYPAEIQLAGTIGDPFGPDPRMKLSVGVANAEIDDINQLLGEQGRIKAAHLVPGVSATTLGDYMATINGEAAGNFEVTGSLQDPAVSGHIDLTDVTASSNHIESAKADMVATNRQLKLNGIVITSGKAVAKGDLVWTPSTGDIKAVLGGTDIDLDRFRAYTRRYADIHGAVDFFCLVDGNVKNPHASFQVVGKDLSVNGQAVSFSTGLGKYADGVISSDPEYGPWSFTVEVAGAGGAAEKITYSIDRFTVSVPTAQNPTAVRRLHVEAHIGSDTPERLSHIIDTVRNSRFAVTTQGDELLKRLDRLPQPIDADIAVPSLTMDGPLDSLDTKGTVIITNAVVGTNRIGSIKTDFEYVDQPLPDVSIVLTANDLNIAGVQLSSVTANGRLDHNVVTVADLRATSDRAYVDLTGKADLGGTIDATLDASDVPLSMLNPLLPHSRSLTGEISGLTVVASGWSRSPDVTATLDIRNPALTVRSQVPGESAGKPASESETSYSLDEINSGPVSIASLVPGGPKILTVDGLTVHKDGAPIATLTGSMPFRWDHLPTMLTSLEPDQAMSATLQINKLSILALATPLIDPDRTSGTLTATLKVDPGLPEPVSGSLLVNNAAFALTGVDTYLHNISGIVSFDSKHAWIDPQNVFTAESSLTGKVTLSGQAMFKDVGKTDVRAVFSAFRVSEGKSAKSLLREYYGSNAQGTLNGTVLVTQSLQGPLLQTATGSPLRFTAASGTIPSAKNTVNEAKPVYPINPHFKMTVAIGSEQQPVTIGNGLLTARMYGYAHINQSLADPKMDAHLLIAGGTFYMPPSTSLQIRPPSYVDLAYPHQYADQTGQLGPPSISEVVTLHMQTQIVVSEAALLQTVSTGSQSMEGPPVSAQFAGLSQAKPYTVMIYMHGDLNDPDSRQITTDLSSQPGGLTNEEIYAALGQESLVSSLMSGGSGAGTAIGQEFSNAVNNVGVPMLLNPLERGFAQAFGLQSFEVQYNPTATSVFASKTIFPRVDLQYIQTVGAHSPTPVNSELYTPEYTLQLSYDITSLLRASLSTDDQQNYAAGLEGVLKFN